MISPSINFKCAFIKFASLEFHRLEGNQIVSFKSHSTIEYRIRNNFIISLRLNYEAERMETPTRSFNLRTLEIAAPIHLDIGNIIHLHPNLRILLLHNASISGTGEYFKLRSSIFVTITQQFARQNSIIFGEDQITSIFGS